MLVGRSEWSYICFGRQRNGFQLICNIGRQLTTTPGLPQHEQTSIEHEDKEVSPSSQDDKVPHKGRMSERLAQMTEESIGQGGKSAEKTVEEAGFSEELKRQLEARIQQSTFSSGNATAFAQIKMPSSAGKGTQMHANAQPWTGQEPLSDSVLRVLNDAHKPLRGMGPRRIPKLKAGNTVDMRMKKAIQRSQGERLANARDRTSVYALSQDPNLSGKEKEQMRKELKERFTASARPMPASVQGLAALANERIEDAIARGQFKNIPRGKGLNIEKDHNANSPFLDTTEYFMNKIIQKQDIVPPWIEKQQELAKTANVFRSRLRNDWKRHAARVIASTGGSLDAQVRRAEAYAAAEVANNPTKPRVEAISAIDAEGRLSQVTVSETRSQTAGSGETKMSVTEKPATDAPDMCMPPAVAESPNSVTVPAPTPTIWPFRDPAWQSLEYAYHTLSITNLNNLTRSYNLQAPDLAKKPYFSLMRELNTCFADVAPQLPNEIRERASRPEKMRVEVVGHGSGGVLERLSREKIAVYDDRKPQYGFKQFWKDLWNRRGQHANI